MAESAAPTLGRGVNLGGWLSQCELSSRHWNSFLTASDFERIREFGFDHIRLPVDQRFVFPSGLGQELSPVSLELLDRVDQWARAAGLWWILDLHETPAHSFANPGGSTLWESDPETQLAAFWLPLLRALGSRPAMVIDLLNEPTITDADAWWTVAEQTIRRIHDVDQRQWIIVESGTLGGAKASLEAVTRLPATPPVRCIYGFHFYEPIAFTHQAAWWSSVLPCAPAPQPYPGRLTPGAVDVPDQFRHCFAGIWHKQRLETLVVGPAAWAQECGIRLHCGEFGVYLEAPPESRYRWVADAVDIFERYGIGWCYWSYKNMGFGILYDHDWRPFGSRPEYRSGMDPRLLDALLGEA